jgi:hypothetical protein
MQNQSPSLFRIISTDYPSYLSVLFPAVFGAFTLYFFNTENNSSQLFLLITSIVTFIGIPTLIQRYRTISSVFAKGIPTKGVITAIGFLRGRGRVEYSYTAQGERYTSSNAINRNGRTRKLRIGQNVNVVVDPDDPKRAFIQEIYL